MAKQLTAIIFVLVCFSAKTNARPNLDINEFVSNINVFDGALKTMASQVGQTLNVLRNQVMPETTPLPFEMNDFDFEAERNRLRNGFNNERENSIDRNRDFVNQRRNEAIEWINSWGPTNQIQAANEAYSIRVENMIAQGNRIFNTANAGNN